MTEQQAAMIVKLLTDIRDRLASLDEWMEVFDGRTK